MRSATVILAALAALSFVGCIESRASHGWPCGPERPCDEGWHCGADYTCHKGYSSTSTGYGTTSTSNSYDGGGNKDAGTDAACVPSCPPGSCGSDGCDGSCGPCPLPIASTMAAPGVEPRALAADGTKQLWVGDSASRVVNFVCLHDCNLSFPATVALPDQGQLIDLAYEPSSELLVALLAEPDGLWELWPATAPTLLADNLSATGVSFYGGDLLTVEAGQLVRRQPDTMQIVGQTPMTESCSLLTISGGAGLRWCAVAGQPSGYVHTLGRCDATHPRSAAELDPIAAELDASELHGLAADDSNLWLLGRGYGQHAGMIAAVQLP